MSVKAPISGSLWEENIKKAVSLIRNNRGFFFTGYLDGDALGTMLSLALYLRQLEKKVFLFLPHPLKTNLNFLEAIIQHNNIEVVHNKATLPEIRSEIDTLIVCDTANAQLVPNISEMSSFIIDPQVSVLEIDHHFGTDSDAVSPRSIRLFRKANACTEIAAELLQKFHSLFPNLPNPFVQRNILLCLLIGMVTDTAGGRVIPIKKDYLYWIEVLGDQLKNGTFTYSKEFSASVLDKNFSSPEDLLNHIHQLTPEQNKYVENFTKKIQKRNGVGQLNLLDSSILEVCNGEVVRDFEALTIIKEYLVNKVPEEAGKVGLLFFNGTDSQEQPCIYIKLRRSFEFEGIDLRAVEKKLLSIFDNDYMGGGGHPSAVSFRVRSMEEDEFFKKINQLLSYLQNHFS